MSLIQIFKTGKHTSANGVTRDYTADELRQCAANYNEDVHAAPFVVGHPKDNGPAYGWPDKVVFDEATGVLGVVPKNVDPAFAEMVNAKRFPKVSSSFYLPDSPTNPLPGTLTLRHVGFLGAAAPAVKGLKEACFAEGEEGIVEHADWAEMDTAGLFRNMRDWLIEKFGLDTADKVIPDYQVNSIRDVAMADDEPSEVEAPAFTEAVVEPVVEAPAAVVEAVVVAAVVEAPVAQAASADFAERESALASREADLAEREEKVRDAEIASFCEAHADKWAPSQTPRLAALLKQMDAAPQEVSFAEGEAPAPAATLLREFLQSLPSVVEFGEVAAQAEAPAAPTATMTVAPGYYADAEGLVLLAKAEAFMAANPGTTLATAAAAVAG